MVRLRLATVSINDLMSSSIFWSFCVIMIFALFQETCRRLLHFTVPRVVAVSPQMRLVEDNPASVSLLHIYKQVRPGMSTELNPYAAAG